jgi:hypothetical protein
MTDLTFISLTVAFFAVVAVVARRASSNDSSVSPLGRRK